MENLGCEYCKHCNESEDDYPCCYCTKGSREENFFEKKEEVDVKLVISSSGKQESPFPEQSFLESIHAKYEHYYRLGFDRGFEAGFNASKKDTIEHTLLKMLNDIRKRLDAAEDWICEHIKEKKETQE